MTRVPRPIALFLTASAAVVLLTSVQAQPPQTAPLPPQPQGQPRAGGDDQFRFKSGAQELFQTLTFLFMHSVLNLPNNIAGPARYKRIDRSALTRSA